MPIPYLKNKGPLLVDKARGYFDRLPPWLRDMVTFRVEKQKVDAKITDLDVGALESELKQEITDEKLRTSRFLGDGEPGSGNDMSFLPASHPSEVVITQTGQVADVTESVSATETHLVEGPPLQDGTSEKVGDVWVTKKVEAPTFNRKVFQQNVDNAMPEKFMAKRAHVLTKTTVDGTAAMPAALGTNDEVKKEEQVKVGVKEITTQQRDYNSPVATLRGQKVNTDFNGVVVNTFEEVVPDTMTITPAFGTTDISVVPYDEQNAVRAQAQATTAFPELVQYNYDPEMDTQVRTTVSIVPHGTALSAVVGMLEYSERKIDSKHKMRVVSDTPGGVATFTTYETRQFSFPALLVSLEFKLAALATAGRSEVQYTAGVRAGLTLPTKHQTNTTFSASPLATNPVIVWGTGDIMFKGISYTINLSNMLYDDWTNIGVTFAADAKYGNIVDRFTIHKTAPSATQYIALIGTLQRVSSTVSRYKRYWVLKDTYVTLV